MLCTRRTVVLRRALASTRTGAGMAARAESSACFRRASIAAASARLASSRVGCRTGAGAAAPPFAASAGAFAARSLASSASSASTSAVGLSRLMTAILSRRALISTARLRRLPLAARSAWNSACERQSSRRGNEGTSVTGLFLNACSSARFFSAAALLTRGFFASSRHCFHVAKSFCAVSTVNAVVDVPDPGSSPRRAPSVSAPSCASLWAACIRAVASSIRCGCPRRADTPPRRAPPPRR